MRDIKGQKAITKLFGRGQSTENDVYGKGPTRVTAIKALLIKRVQLNLSCGAVESTLKIQGFNVPNVLYDNCVFLSNCISCSIVLYKRLGTAGAFLLRNIFD